MKLHIKVITKSSENKIVEDQEDLFGERFLKIKTTAIPENGAANKAIIDILSDYLGVAKSRIFIVKGHKTTNKIVEVR
jgi:uncharacterized protein YggU (UPF0235/DUF167 family)